MQINLGSTRFPAERPVYEFSKIKTAEKCDEIAAECRSNSINYALKGLIFLICAVVLPHLTYIATLAIIPNPLAISYIGTFGMFPLNIMLFIATGGTIQSVDEVIFYRNQANLAETRKIELVNAPKRSFLPFL